MGAPAQQPAVVVAGDALIDLTPTTTRDGRPAYEPHPGGSCLNVAVGLGRLDVPVAFLGRLSTDAFGALLRAHLQDSSVSPDYVVDTDDPTTLAAVHLTAGQATYSFYANGTADAGLLPSHLAPLPPGATLHVGSLGLVLEPVASTLEALLQQEAGRRIISLDPNVRPGLIRDRAAYLARLTTWVPAVDVLKVSDEDLSWLHPDRGEDDVVQSWLAAGVSLVLVTRGSGGAHARTAAAAAQVAAEPVTVADTVGAGDAFMAGALAHLHLHGMLSSDALRAADEAALTALLRSAAVVAADTCTRPGADPPRLGALRERGWPFRS